MIKVHNNKKDSTVKYMERKSNGKGLVHEM